MHHEYGNGAHQLHAEVPVGHAVDGVAGDIVEAQLCRLKAPVGGIRRSGQSAGADGTNIHPLPAVAQTAEIPQEHHGVGHQVVGKQDGLRPLQMGVAGHDDALIIFRLRDDRPKHILYQRGDLIDLVFEIHSQVQRHLIVPAAGGVELFAHIPQPLGQHLLDEHMDVLAAKVEFQRPGFQIAQNALQPVNELPGLGLRDDALRPQHGGMSHGAGDVLLIKFAVKADGRIEIIRNAADLAGSPSGP